MSKRLTQDEFVQKVNNKYDGKFEVVGDYVNAKTPVQIKHNDCGTIFPRVPNKMTAKGKNCTCPVCDGYKAKKPLIGVNDLWTTHPEIAKLFKNPEDGYKYSKGSNDYADFLCPYCNSIVNKMVYEVVSRNYLPCPCCSSGKSYPNRFMANLLRELGVDFIPEYIIKPYPYYFDFYFKINNKEYIVEMDGGIGHGNKEWGGNKDIKGFETDLIKDKICKDHNITIIRIDCNYLNNRFEYVKKAIINSDLNILFDFNAVNFNQINQNSCSSLIIDVADYWNQGIHSYDKLMVLTNLSHSTIRRYLKEACNNNYIEDKYTDVLREIRYESNQKISFSKSCPIICNQTNEVYVSIKEAQNKTGITNIRMNLCGKYSYAGKLPDGTKLTWTKLSNEEYEQMLTERTS